MAIARSERHQVIRDIVRGGSIRTQRDLVEALKKHGYDLTQATISRDIADMDLQKDSDGRYALVGDLKLRTMATTMIRGVRGAGNQVIILTEPGSANSVAAALDAVELPGVLGSIAGDDTILVITQDEHEGEKFYQLANQLIAGTANCQ
jgi:transcriptional regulator of arginine metabolism